MGPGHGARDARRLAGLARARVVVLVALLANALHADPSFRVECGYRNVSVGGEVMPVAVTLTGDAIDRQVELWVNGRPEVRYRLELPRATAKRVYLYTSPEPPSSQLSFPEIHLIVDGRITASESLASDVKGAFSRVIPAVGGPGLGLEESGIVSPVVDPGALPLSRRGFISLDAIWIYPDAWAQLDRRVIEALWLWTLEGGVILSPARSRSSALGLPHENPFGPIAECTPHTVRGFRLAARRYLQRARRDETVTVTDVHSLTDLPEDFRVTLAFELPPREKKAAGDEARGDEGEAEERTPPVGIAAEKTFGRGKLVVFAFDPVRLAAERSEERQEWKLFLAAILTASPRRQENYAALATRAPCWPEGSSADTLWGGVTPQGASGASITWFGLFLVVYLLLIGPLDYWLVRRWNRPRLTWVTFPSIVVVFCVAAWVLGRGRIGRFEQRALTVIECAGAPAAIAWGRSFVGIYSDTNAPLTMQAEAESAEVDAAASAGTDSVYYGGSAGESLRQKMHIWAYHGYRVVWPERGVVLAASVAATDGVRPTIELEERLPAEPIARLLARGGKYFQLVPREEVGDGRFLVEVGGEVPHAELSELSRRSLGGFGSVDFYAALAATGPLRADQGRDGHVVAVLGGDWPALTVKERSGRGTRRGLSIVRAPLSAPRPADER